ncbi:MAG: hypothetical protein RIN55_05540 [Tissierellaceae bacterium]|nr:hypothetical protein [Tissierellaceae bacterium]
MKNFYYYARLNDNNVCIEIVSRVSKLTDVQGYVELTEYNETVRYRKWLGDHWSQETYEPDVDTVVQDTLKELKEENQQLSNQVSTLQTTLQNVNSTNETLIQSIAELTAIISTLQAPTE